MKRAWVAAAAAAAVLGLGCGDSGGGDGGHLSPSDDLAMHACEHVGMSEGAITAASDPADVASAVLEGNGEPVTVTLPASGVGYVRFESPYEHYDWAFFASNDAMLVGPLVYIPNGIEFALGTGLPDGACPDAPILDYRSHLHEMGGYVLEIHGEPGAMVWVMATATASDHVHGDGGMEDGGVVDDGGASVDGGTVDDGGAADGS